MFTRNKLVIWLAVFFILSTFCRKKYSGSSAQYLINGVMIVFGIATTYSYFVFGMQKLLLLGLKNIDIEDYNE
jgi:hypothetical protein